MVVYHLHGQNRSVHYSELVNFARNRVYHSVQIRSIYRKTAAKTWNWYQRWLFMQFCLNHSVRKNRKTFSDIPLLLFPIKRPKKSGPFTCQHDSFQKLFAIGKQLISQKSQWTPTWRGENEHCSYNFLSCKVFNCFTYRVVLVRKCKATGFSAEWKYLTRVRNSRLFSVPNHKKEKQTNKHSKTAQNSEFLTNRILTCHRSKQRGSLRCT